MQSILLKTAHSLVLLLALLLLQTCAKEDVAAVAATPVQTYDRIEGFVQKGPFLNGTSIQLSELSPSMLPTGSTFSSQIVDNSGSFSLRGVQLESSYVQLRADGFYYNEVTDESSSAQLTLYALSDLTRYDGLNVNLLSHLEKARVEYLMDGGMTFFAAKAQAQGEIFAIFGIQQRSLLKSEVMNIARAGSDNGKLLAISLILQGYLPVADFSELLANISTDIREDGVLNSRQLGTQLINNARLLRPTVIREQLQLRYELLGKQVSIPNFERYIAQFIATTDFEPTNDIQYPPTDGSWPNLLDTTQISEKQGRYAIVAELPVSTRVKVRISGSNWGFVVTPPSTSGWNYSNLNPSDTSRVFTSNRSGTVSLPIVYHIPPNPRDHTNDHIPGMEDYVPPPDSVIVTPPPLPVYTRIEVYENDAEEPNWTKTFVVKQ